MEHGCNNAGAEEGLSEEHGEGSEEDYLSDEEEEVLRSAVDAFEG